MHQYRKLLAVVGTICFFFFSSRRRHTRLQGDWSSDVCSSDLSGGGRRPCRRSRGEAGGQMAGGRGLRGGGGGAAAPARGRIALLHAGGERERDRKSGV